MTIKIKLITSIILLSASLMALSETQEDGLENSRNQAQGNPNLTLKKHVISSGGGVSTGGNYSLTSSIGQIDAGHNASNGAFTIRGGFLQQNSDLIYKNGFE